MYGVVVTKTVVIITFLLFFVGALWTQLSKERPNIKDELKKSEGLVPEVVLEDFSIFRYTGNHLDSEISGQIGQFVDPNRVQAFGEAKATKYEAGRTQTLIGGQAVAFFKAKTVQEMMGSPELVRVEMSKNVKMNTSDHIIFTDEADYTALTNTVTSSRPVRVEGDNQWFTGERGFQYEVDSENVRLYGKVRGMVMPADQEEAHNQ